MHNEDVPLCSNVIWILVVTQYLDILNALILGILVGKYEAVHPQSSWVTSLGGLCKRNEGILQTKEKRKKEGIISRKLFICARLNLQIRSQHA